MWSRKKRQNLIVKRSCESLAMLVASNEIAFVMARKNKPFSDCEDTVKPCLHRTAVHKLWVATPIGVNL